MSDLFFKFRSKFQERTFVDIIMYVLLSCHELVDSSLLVCVPSFLKEALKQIGIGPNIFL